MFAVIAVRGLTVACVGLFMRLTEAEAALALHHRRQSQSRGYWPGWQFAIDEAA